MSRTLEDNLFEVRVVRETASLLPGTIRRGLVQSGNLAATTQITLEHELRESVIGQTWITRENPYLSAAEQVQLDANGLIRVGSIVSEKTILASIVRTTGSAVKGRIQIHDESWDVPNGWDDARVVAIERESSAGRRREFPRGVLERLRVRLQRTVPFHLSDSLTIEDHVVQTRFLADDERLPTDSSGHPADLVIPQELADLLQLQAGEVKLVSAGRNDPAAVDVLQARSTGPYSLITAMPLGGTSTRRAGIPVTDDHITWLAARGLSGLISEFVSLKSDDLQNRPVLGAIARGEADAGSLHPAAPETCLEMQEYLWALGLSVDARSTDQGVAISLRPAAGTDVISRSCGAIRKSETINYRTYLPEPGGLFCETVFGPEESSVRRRRSGHVELVEPIIPIIWRLGSQPVLARILDMQPEDLEKVLFRSSVVYVRNEAMEFRKTGGSSDSKMLAKGWTNVGTGTEAIKQLLERLSPDRIPLEFGPRGERFFLHSIPVIPPDLRPLVLLDSGNFATSDLNDLYRRLINRNNRLSKLKQLNAPEPIIDNETQELQRAVDCLQANMFVPKRKQVIETGDRQLVCLSNLFISRITRDNRKRVEWAGQARAIHDAQVDARRVSIPDVIFDELKLHNDQPILLTTQSAFVARLPQRIDGPLIHLNPADAHVFLMSDQVVSVHRPLTEAAQREAQRLLTGEVTDQSRPVPLVDDWCRHTDVFALLDDLIDAATTARPVTIRSSRGLFLFGTGPTTSELADRRLEKAIHWTDVPEQRPQPPPPSIEQMAKVIEGHRRLCCLLHVEEAQGDRDPSQGRIGGLPWMPVGSKWPCNANGEPLEFVGQLPLDPAREAGLMPFDVPPRSLLTVFCNQGEWEHPASTEDGSLVIHGVDNLVELQPPEQTYHQLTRFDIRPEVCYVYPDANQALQIVLWELDGNGSDQWRKFEEEYTSRFPNPEDVSRIGGYPHWVQGPEDIAFVAQIASDGVSEINFGDAGSLYIHGKSADNLSAMMQSY